LSFGLNLYSSGGSLSYSSTDVTWNQVGFFSVAGGADVTRSFPALSGREVLVTQVFLNPPPTDRRAYAHTIVVTGISVHVYGGSEEVYVLVLMR